MATTIIETPQTASSFGLHAWRGLTYLTTTDFIESESLCGKIHLTERVRYAPSQAS